MSTQQTKNLRVLLANDFKLDDISLPDHGQAKAIRAELVKALALSRIADALEEHNEIVKMRKQL